MIKYLLFSPMVYILILVVIIMIGAKKIEYNGWLDGKKIDNNLWSIILKSLTIGIIPVIRIIFIVCIIIMVFIKEEDFSKHINN